MESSGPKRRFPPPWTVTSPSPETFVVSDANGIPVAWVHHRDETLRYAFGAARLTTDEARRIANAIARIPEFMTQRRGFHARGEGKRWNVKRPYHVALEDSYPRAHWHEITALCNLNSLPFNATGEKIRDSGMCMSSHIRWTPFCFGHSLMDDGYGATSFTTLSAQQICLSCGRCGIG